LLTMHNVDGGGPNGPRSGDQTRPGRDRAKREKTTVIAPLDGSSRRSMIRRWGTPSHWASLW